MLLLFRLYSSVFDKWISAMLFSVDVEYLSLCVYVQMSPEKTRDLLLEVTGDSSLDVCKSIMDTLLQRMLELGLGDGSAGDSSGHKRLTVEQVRIVDQHGQLRVVYPSRTDLQSDAFVTAID